MHRLTTNQATLALAVTALLRWMVNELAATSGTAERTQTPLRSCCKVASTRLAAVSATPAWVADDLPAATVRMPLRLNTAGPAALATPCTPLPAEAVPATPSPAGEPKPATPMPLLPWPWPSTPVPAAPPPKASTPTPLLGPPLPCTPAPLPAPSPNTP